MARIDDLRLMTRIAQLYYVERKTQSAISQALNISQATISRLLKRAEDEDIVRITINAPRGTFLELESSLRERYSLREAIVAECAEDTEEQVFSAVGAAAAHLVETSLRPGEVIGLSSWSASLLRMVEAIHPGRSAAARRVIQLLGGTGNPAVEKHATHLTMRLAQLTRAEPQLLTAPSVTASDAARRVLEKDAYVRATLDQFRDVTLALVGIGAVEPSKMLADSGNRFTPEELDQLRDGGAVGDICLRFFDLKGAPVRTALDRRIIGISLKELSAIPRVVGVAGGARKVEAIRAALLGRHVNVLVTDRFTAERLLEPGGEAAESRSPATARPDIGESAT